MADHVQDQVLEAIRATLVAANTAAGSDVYVERVDPLPAAKCPVIAIEAGDEEIAPPTSVAWPRLQNRVFEVWIRNAVALADGYRVAAGNLAKETEKALCATASIQQLGGIARMGVHLRSSAPERAGDGDKPLYVIVQRWQVGYQTRANAPDVPL